MGRGSAPPWDLETLKPSGDRAPLAPHGAGPGEGRGDGQWPTGAQVGRPQLPLPSGPSGLSCRALGTGPVAKGPEDVGLAASATPPGGPHGPLPPNDASHLKAGSETVSNSQKRRGFGTKVPFLGRPKVRPLPSVARRSRVTGVGPRHPRGAVFPHPGFGVRGSLGQSVGFWAVGPKTSAATCGWFCVASNCFCTSVPTFLPALLGFALNLSSSENGVNGRKTFFPLKRRDVCTLTPRAWLCNRGVRCAALGCSGAWGVRGVGAAEGACARRLRG